MRVIGDILPQIIEREGATIAKHFKGPVFLANANQDTITLSDGHNSLTVPIERDAPAVKAKRNRR